MRPLNDCTAQILERHRRSINPGWADLIEAIGLPIDQLTGKGSWLIGPDGSGLLDMLAGFGTTVLGHNHPGLTAALHRALDRGTPMTAPLGVVPEAGQLAGRLLELAGHGLTKVQFGSSGAEAVDTALKLSAAKTGRYRFASVTGGFHGLSVGATGLAGNDWWRAPFPNLWLSTTQIEPGDISALERLLAHHDIAALIIEIVPGSDASDGWTADALVQAETLCRRHGTLIVIDEIQTALGRSGSWFAFHSVGDTFCPDMVIISKALTGGIVPFSALLMTEPVFQATFGAPSQAKIHGSTLAGNRLAMECGLAVLDLIEEKDLVSRANKVGCHIRASLSRSGMKIFGRGLLLAIEIGKTAQEANQRCVALIQSGVLVSTVPHAPTCIRVTPALTIAEEDVDLFVEALVRTL